GCTKGRFRVNSENFYSLVHPDDREKVRGAMIKALSGGESYHIEHRTLLPDGTERYMLERAEVLRDSKGVPTKLTGTVMDITERKMADEAIRQSERIYRTLVETTNTGYLIIDLQGNVLNANAEYVLLTGHRSIDEIRGRCVLEWTATYDIERNRQELDKTKASGKVRNLEIDYRHSNGFIQPIEINATLIDSEQGPCMIVLVRDISERRRAQHEQERLVSILEATTDLVSTASPDLHLLYLNRGGRQMMGYGDQQSAPHRHVSDMLPGESLAMIRDEAIPEANSLGIWTGEAMLLHRDGHMIPVSALLIAHRSDEGLLEYYSMVFRDLSDQRKIELQRQEIERKLQETQKLESLGVLAGGIAHDFNNLLTGILGNASLARLQMDEGSGIDPYLDQIEKASLRAADLCKQMLAYSGKGRFIVQRIQLTDLVEDTTPLLHLSISKKAVLKFHLVRDLPPTLADATQIRQILMNLVINASEAIGDRSGVISISTGVMRADTSYLADTHLSPNLPQGDYVFLEVSDNGCGMSAETRARIFDPFFTTKFTGRGLGLAAVLGIVRGHQGALKVFSEPGKGTTFKMLLPCADGPVEKFQSHDSTHAPLWSGKGMILVVDDEETVRTVTARMLESLGFQTTLAEDGREAVKIFLERPGTFTYVMLDLTMPHMDGEETFRELRRIRPNIRVLLMSGFNEQDATSRFVGKGLAGFLQKPFKADQLASKLQEIENDLRDLGGS
ncbi:MAG TPA: PAS domain S-box protein, partial [Roseimicrobium sp.]|nr:PAS domain S-box protein [Roseimicrobium sp.]